MSGGPKRDRAVDVVDGGLVWPLIVLSIPIVLTNLLHVGYNLADTFWVGQLGPEGVSALSYAWAIVFLVISFAIGFTVAGTVLVAQNKGAGNIDRVSSVAGQTVTFVFVVSAMFAVVGFLLAPQLLQLIGARPGTLEYTYALQYVRAEFIGMPLIFAFFIFQSLLQGWGDTRTPLYLMTASVALNVAIDPFFILGFQDNLVFTWLGLESLEASLYEATGFDGLGVMGAAIATVLSRALVAAVGLWLLLSGRVGIQLTAADFVPEREMVTKILSIGAPASVEVSTSAASVTVLTALVALAGADAAVGAYGIGSRITSVVVLPALGLARGVETVVGQNLGAGQVERAKRGVYAGVVIIVSALLLFSVGVYTFAETIVSPFVTGEGAATVIGIGTEYLQIISLSFVFLGVFYIVQGGFRGSGSTRVAMVFAIVGFIVFRAVFAYVLAEPLGYGTTGVWYGEAIANVCMAVLAGLYFLRGTWVEGVVVDRRGQGPASDASAQPGDETSGPVANGGVDDR
ncbi:MATE family efflux transporter [Natronobiforma cellulositropha]|uniref:MATE family efflux transporter n=1 Tax=Natronobiforma cellulositropha TaxID=1679076 RepID=UPI0021D5753D|nr:MATE family efflux transporter [Natronobiforma cellulositropha]